MTYSRKIQKLDSLDKFINGRYQDDIILVLDKKYKEDKWGLICAVMHWFRVVEPYLDCKKVLKENTKDYNWGNVYLYLCSVDIVTKGINDLYKMINKTNKHIFDGENDIFQISEIDDNHHFQNIRAIFGAHPTDLNGNGDFFVATYPTPYNWDLSYIRGNSKRWDYYTLLWSKEKSEGLLQKEFGFSFCDIDRYLDKHIDYLHVFYTEMEKMINNYYLKQSNKKINIIKDINKQIDLLIIEDEKRFKKKYNYELKTLKMMINIYISDENNKKEYIEYRNKLISSIPKIYKVIQNPSKYKSLSFMDKIIDCNMDFWDKNTPYYYSKLLEYNNNKDMKKLLINYFGDKITPFNSNIRGIKELFCLVKAHNYYLSMNK